MANIVKILIISGIMLIASGIGIYLLQKFNIPFGKLPGDIVIKKETYSFYFPVTTSIIISIILSIILYIFRK